MSDGGKGPLAGDVIQQHDPVCPPEVGLGDGPEPLLARGVPQLDGDVAVVHADGLHLEVDPECGAQVGHEDPLGDPVDEGRLAHSSVPSKHHFVCSIRGSSGLKVSQFPQSFLSFSGNVLN